MYDQSMGPGDEVTTSPRITSPSGTLADPDLNPLDANNDDILPDGDDHILNADPDMNPLDADNDDILPDSDDPSKGTVLDPNAHTTN